MPILTRHVVISWEDAHGDIHQTHRSFGATDSFIDSLDETPGCRYISAHIVNV